MAKDKSLEMICFSLSSNILLLSNVTEHLEYTTICSPKSLNTMKSNA